MLLRVFILSLLGISASVFAGEWQVKVGASVLAPSSDHNTMADGAVTEAKADHAFSFTPSIEYFLPIAIFHPSFYWRRPLNIMYWHVSRVERLKRLRALNSCHLHSR